MRSWLTAEELSRVTIEGHEDPGTTGNFEIRIDGQLVHSKKTKRHGFLHNNTAQQEVVRSKLKEALGN
ncbi:rdx family protein [Cystoisospora suis]|uniref:Rdx family protein n=1 Tax=Cystoisospora suis TaxID=483139 RepID=A0A2C6KZ33_9APIC|nr:rdx family protein [Cystoisospora suis]